MTVNKRRFRVKLHDEREANHHARRRQKETTDFSYDINQIMHCIFVDQQSGEKKEVSLSMTESANSGGGYDIKKLPVE